LTFRDINFDENSFCEHGMPYFYEHGMPFFLAAILPVISSSIQLSVFTIVPKYLNE